MKKNTLMRKICAVFFAFSAVAMLGGIHAAAKNDLPAPTINVSPDIYYPLDEVLFVEGRAGPLTTVQIRFEMPGVKPLTLNVKSDANGEWTLAEKVPLDAGTYEIRARIAPEDGTPSPWSNPRIIKSIITGFSIGGLTLKYAPTALIVIVILFASFALLMYAVFRVRIAQRLEQDRETREKIAFFEKALRDKERESEQTQEMHAKADALEKELLEKEREIARMAVEQKFSDIKRGVLDELEHLENKMRHNGQLSGEEEEHRARLVRELREAEAEIEKRLKE